MQPVINHLNMIGMKVEDMLTGMKGVVTSVTFDLYGCVQALLYLGIVSPDGGSVRIRNAQRRPRAARRPAAQQSAADTDYRKMNRLDIHPTAAELRAAFKLSGLWRNGWTFAKAVRTTAVYVGLRATVAALRAKHEKNGKPAPIQQVLI